MGDIRDEYKVGDVVAQPNGLPMTVKEVISAMQIECVWFDCFGAHREGTFDPGTLAHTDARIMGVGDFGRPPNDRELVFVGEEALAMVQHRGSRAEGAFIDRHPTIPEKQLAAYVVALKERPLSLSERIWIARSKVDVNERFTVDGKTYLAGAPGWCVIDPNEPTGSPSIG